MIATSEPTTWIRMGEARQLAGGVSLITLKRWIRDRKVRVSRPGRILLIDKGDLLRFLDTHASGGICPQTA